ncbi:MAG: DUF4388 domain-containing protein [Candidatus Zixiibacteriota bacterium]
MDIDKSGELEETKAAEVLAAIYRARAYGLAHFKGPAGETIYVTFERGRARHASGNGREGDAALYLILTWDQGEYRFIEDVKSDEDDFPLNIPAELAESLCKVEDVEEEREDEAAEVIPPLPVLPEGESSDVFTAKTADDLKKKLGESGFSGYCAVGPPDGRAGLLLISEGEAVCCLLWDGEGFGRFDDVWSGLAPFFDRSARECALYETDAPKAEAINAGLSGRRIVARVPSAVVNVDEFLAWVGDTGMTGLISIIAGDRAANILISGGDVLGAVVAPENVLRRETDEALALFYTPGATFEAFALE